VSLQVIRRALETTAKVNCRTRVTLANWRGAFAKGILCSNTRTRCSCLKLVL